MIKSLFVCLGIVLIAVSCVGLVSWMLWLLAGRVLWVAPVIGGMSALSVAACGMCCMGFFTF